MIDRSSETPLYKQLKTLICKKIEEKTFTPGTLIPSERKLCEMFGVSRITLREALNELKNEGVLYTSTGRGTYVKALNYEKTSQRNCIGLICPNTDSEVTLVGNMINGIDFELKKVNCNLFLRMSNDNPEEELQILKEFSNCTNGIISVPAMHNKNHQYYEEISQNIPVVFAERKLENVKMPYVGYDNISATRQVVAQLLKKGHKKIAFVSEDDEISPAKERYEGYRQAFKETGRRLDYSLVKWLKTRHKDNRYSYDLIKDFIKDKNPNAIFFAYRNTFALHAVKAIRELNMQIPEEFEIAGFCSFPAGVSGSSPFIELNCDSAALEMGKKAARLLLKQMENRKTEKEELICIKNIRKVKI
jgi:GntR family transcriptional regulator of arabinose operon